MGARKIYKVLVYDNAAPAINAAFQTTPVKCRGAVQVTFVAQATDADQFSASTLECSAEAHGIGSPTWYNATALGTLSTGQLHANALNGGGAEMFLRPSTTGGYRQTIPAGWVRANVTTHTTNQQDNVKIWALVEFDGEGPPVILEGSAASFLTSGPSF